MTEIANDRDHDVDIGVCCVGSLLFWIVLFLFLQFGTWDTDDAPAQTEPDIAR